MNYKSFNSKEQLMFRLPSMVVDLCIHIAVFFFLLSVFDFTSPEDKVLLRPRSIYFLVVGYIIAAVVCPSRFYERGVRIRQIVGRVFLQCFVTLSIFALSVQVLFDSFAGKFFLQEGIMSVAVISLWHILFRTAIIRARKLGRNKVHVVIVGSDYNAVSLYRRLTGETMFNDYKVLGFFTENEDELPEGATCLGHNVTDVNTYLASNKVHVLYCSINPAKDPEAVNSIIRTCENIFVDFYYVPNMDGYLHRTMIFEEIGGVTVVKLRDEPLANPLNAFVKRTFDILFSGLFLVTVYPFVWLFVAVGTRISSPGPILFRQTRTGYKGKPFTMYKFRSMKVNADADKIQATEDDPRKTCFGDFLRRTSIDELPQLINIFKGDMSIIGPRPHMELHTEVYTKLVDEYLVRHMVRPGLTGWAQVNGCRGETRTTEQMADRVRHDIWYIEHWSLWLDVKIFFMTIFQILRGDEQAY